VYSVITVALGISGMILACTYDIIRNRELEFGLDQVAGFVVSAIITLSGCRRMPFLSTSQWHGFLLAIYYAGIFFMGLKTKGHQQYQAVGPLQDTGIYLGDVAINFLGFVPLGYLVATYLLVTNFLRRSRFQFLFAICLCTGTSFFIELAQFYLPGRTSSFIDFLGNGAGAVCGSAYGFLAHKLLVTNRIT